MTHNLPKKTESWHFTANHSSNSVTRVDSNSGENSWKQRWFITHLTNFSHKCQRQSGYFRSMLISIFARNSRDDHVLVIYSFYFVNIKIVNQSLQFFVYIIQVIPWLKWCQMLYLIFWKMMDNQNENLIKTHLASFFNSIAVVGKV